jgi:hypothetical protein
VGAKIAIGIVFIGKKAGGNSLFPQRSLSRLPCLFCNRANENAVHVVAVPFRLKFCLCSTGEALVHNQPPTMVTQPFGPGDVIGVGHTVGTQRLFFTLNGKFVQEFSTEIVDAAVGGDVQCVLQADGHMGAIVAGNFGQSAFAYEVQS